MRGSLGPRSFKGPGTKDQGQRGSGVGCGSADEAGDLVRLAAVSEVVRCDLAGLAVVSDFGPDGQLIGIKQEVFGQAISKPDRRPTQYFLRSISIRSHAEPRTGAFSEL